MFKPVPTKLNHALLEEEMLRFWNAHHILEKSAAQCRGAPDFVLYEVPPTVNRKPGMQHVPAFVYKDVFSRYQTLRGRRVIRRGGWDAHGLSVEVEAEKHLGLISKVQIEQYGIARFNEQCRKLAFDFIQDWERLEERLGGWTNLKEAAITFANPYIGAVWGILKQLWEKGLLYQEEKMMPYCPRCGTPLSEHEAKLACEQTTVPAAFVRLPLVDDPGTALLVWTSAPWKLPGSVAVAAHPQAEYVIVEHDLPEGEAASTQHSEKLILARALLETVFHDQKVSVYETFKGTRLKGLRYQPLFKFTLTDKPAHRVILTENINLEQGSGLAPVSPLFNAPDQQAAAEHDLPMLETIAPDGTFLSQVRPWRGLFFKDAEGFILQDLQERGLLFRSEAFTQTRPFCRHCGASLLDYPRQSWYLRTSAYQDKLAGLNQRVHCIPEHSLRALLGGWLEKGGDWAVGRQRYWGTPLPIWQCVQCGQQMAVGSATELAALAGRKLEDVDLHRPGVDEIAFPCPECSGLMRRVPEVVDAWFDSGVMPLLPSMPTLEGQQGYPAKYPADLIYESSDQMRGWFYALQVVSAALLEGECCRNLICLEPLQDENVPKTAEKRVSTPGSLETLDKYGADVLRWYAVTADLAVREQTFTKDVIGTAQRDFVQAVWNAYAFFVAYSQLENWQPARLEPEERMRPLDRWLLSRLQGLIVEVTTALEALDVPKAVCSLQLFVDHLSKWHLKHSRRSFQKGAPADELRSAFAALYQTLVTLSRLLAPFLPFLSEEMYQNLVRSVEVKAPESVHLSDWPTADAVLSDALLETTMERVMKLAALGQSARAKASMKEHQPLSELTFWLDATEDAESLQPFSDLLAEELNIRLVRVRGAEGEAIDAQAAARPGLAAVSEGPCLAVLTTDLTPDLVSEGLASELVRRLQDFRKTADLGLTDPIRLFLSATPRLAEAIRTYRMVILEETRCLELQMVNDAASPPLNELSKKLFTIVEFEGERVTIGMEKV